MLYTSFRWPSAETLSDLVREAQTRQSDALENLLAVLRPSLLAFFRERHGADTAEDLTQLALIRIAAAIDRIDPMRADSYLSTVARNLLRTAYRTSARNRSRDSELETEELASQTLTADRRAEYEDLALAVHRACLTKLTRGQREVAIGLLHGETTQEIATELHISPVTVRTRLMRVRAVLRSELAAYLERANSA